MRKPAAPSAGLAGFRGSSTTCGPDVPSVEEGEKFVVSIVAGELEVPEVAAVLVSWTRSTG